ncbi:MAG: glycosyltransferase [Deltaproteobacteria bacterium]|nr:glycosyltransferase [Deltaproteobacteria bacterium]
MHSVLTSDQFLKSSNADQRAALPELSVVLAAWNEGGNIKPLIERLKAAFEALHITSEIIVVDGGSTDSTCAEAEQAGARCLLQRRIGYGGAVREGFLAARGDYVLTLDCDLSHPPELFPELWKVRNEADVIIGSRFVKGGASQAPFLRKILSEILNFTFSTLLQVPIKDSSSGYRLYRRRVLQPENYTRENFNILQEVLVKAYADGFSVKEVPLQYEERAAGASHVSLVKFCLSYLPTLYRLWILRNSTNSADYDRRAYFSRHFLQRYWQRARYSIVREFSVRDGLAADVGCGSSKIIEDAPEAIALDLEMHKLRFLKGRNRRRVRADCAALPFQSASLQQLVVSQVLQSVPRSADVFRELNRVLVSGGNLVVSVPDSRRIQWRIIGFLYHRLLPNVYSAGEETSYGRRELIDLCAEHGFRVAKYRYICGAELILKLTKVENLE